MASITTDAKAFFEACESGKGWQACAPFCHADASFACQADALADVRSLEAYAEWMKGLLTFIPDGRYNLHAFATDAERNTVLAFATFQGTHTGQGGPMPPTGRSTSTDYVYAMRFEDGRIRHMTKIWNAGWATRELGWSS